MEKKLPARDNLSWGSETRSGLACVCVARTQVLVSASGEAGRRPEPGWRHREAAGSAGSSATSLCLPSSRRGHQTPRASKRDSQPGLERSRALKMDAEGHQGNREETGPRPGAGRRRPKDLGWRRTGGDSGLNRQRRGSPMALSCRSTGPGGGSRGSENSHIEPHMRRLGPPS